MKKLVAFQHEETGNICVVPEGANIGRRWYRVPDDRQEYEIKRDAEELDGIAEILANSILDKVSDYDKGS